MATIIEQFSASGFSEESAISKGELLGRCLKALGTKSAAHVFYVPGRVEVMGKHTDYAGGRSLTCALDRGFVVAVGPRSDTQCVVHACDMRESVGFELRPDLKVPERGWGNYVLSLAKRVAANFGGPLRGADIAFASDLPQSGGMSSSSALLVAAYLALDCVNGFSERKAYQNEIRTLEDLAGYLGACENGQSFGSLSGDRGAGTFGGSEDHTAILCSKPGQLSMYTYCPVRLEQRVDFPAELAMVIASSGVAAEKTAAAKEKYNRISRLAQAIMEVLAAEGWTKPTLAAAIGDDREAAECVRQILSSRRHPQFRPPELLGRFEQFAQEHQKLAPGVADALVQRDWITLAQRVEQSQMLAENNLHNQTPQTVALTRLAKRHGAVAASAFGAGFGGSVWAMAKKADAGEFVKAWEASYRQQFPQEAPRSVFFQTAPLAGAMKL